MIKTYGEWVDIVDSLAYDAVLVDMLSDWQADGIRLTKCIDALESRIEELEAERRWIPVSERLPELNQDVLGLVDDEIVAGSFYQDLVYGVYFSDGGSGMLVATHWMPLPELPEVER